MLSWPPPLRICFGFTGETRSWGENGDWESEKWDGQEMRESIENETKMKATTRDISISKRTYKGRSE